MPWRLALPAALLGLLLIKLLVLRPEASSAQTPVPTPTPQTNMCGPAQHSGGQTITVLNLQFTLPAPGDYSSAFARLSSGETLVRVCYLQGNSEILFRQDGSERNRMVNNAAAANVLNAIAASVKTVSATPALTPTPSAGICAAGTYVSSGGELTLASGVKLTLPTPGDYFLLLRPATASPWVAVCYVQGNAAVYLTEGECRETQRTPASSAANAVLDQIVRSCVPAGATSAPPAGMPGGGTQPPVIRPPDTGSAGLLAIEGD
ncbi:MAG TPA: hypothetical protein VJB57_14030 [Dehalococcoidia bacterium]|nr:hypothetical protein [Dehalococcoidia bacterium]